jgi:septal ring factor EnvC (AmiA/AmiB activator)
MTEHRLVIDPGVMRRLANSMVAFANAWDGDIAELRRVESELEDTKRLLNAATDRASDLQGDLRAVRQENADLIKRTAHLEAQIQSLYDKSLDARDALGSLATRAVDVARTAPTVAAHSQWKDPEKTPPGENDGTGLPRGQPAFLHKQSNQPAPIRPPANEFQPRHAVAAE